MPDEAPDPPTARTGPLSHLTVIDLTRVRAGPTCVRQFADWGANVIKVEMPGGGNDFASRRSSDFQNLHRNKRSLTLNLKEADGVAVLKRLAETADVVVENYRPDVKHRLGIDYDALSAVNPRLVYTSISGFGQTGPYADRPGLDQVAQGLGGLMSVTGAPGEGPMRAGIPVADLSAGLLAALGTMTALLEREVSGRGQWVHSSLLEAQAFMLDLQAVRWLVDGEVPWQVGNNHPTTAPMGAFATLDGHINLAPTGQRWPDFCQALGLEDMIEDPDFADNDARLANREALNERVEAVTSTESSAHWVEVLNAAGVPCGPIHTIDQTFEDPQVKHMGLAQEVVSESLGPLTLVGQAVNLSRTPSALRTAADTPGGHTDEILGDLGYSEAEIADFRERGVV